MSEPASSRNSSSLAAVFESPRRLDLCDLPIPSLHAGEALVRVTYCTICGSDLHTFTGARTEPTPSIIGHEIVGVVDSVGDPPLNDVLGAPLEVGDRVTWSTSIACGTCDRCTAELPQKCRTLAKYGHELATGREALSGGLAEFVLLRPGTAAVKLDGVIPDPIICPVNCATATVAAAFRAAGKLADQRVLIFGAGMLGLTAAAYAKSCGASQIVVCDRDATRLERALNFGAGEVVLWNDDRETLGHDLQTGGQASLFDVVLELSGAPAAIEVGCDLADIAARLVLVGTVLPCDPVRLDPERIVRRCLSIRGVHNYAPADLQAAVNFLQEFHKSFPFAKAVERTFPLRSIDEAFEFALRERPVRVAVTP